MEVTLPIIKYSRGINFDLFKFQHLFLSVLSWRVTWDCMEADSDLRLAITATKNLLLFIYAGSAYV